MSHPSGKLSLLLVTLLLAALIFAASCFRMRSSRGGGQQATFNPPRKINIADIAVPEGYKVELVAQRLTFPTGIAFDEAGVPYVVEAGYSYGEVWTTPRLLRLEQNGQHTAIATGSNNGPWNGIDYANGNFYVAEGGAREGGRILKISKDGQITTLVDKLPSVGDHHTNGPRVAPDGKIYFGQGVATNSAIVGEDSAKFGWLPRHPEFHDIPCKDITLTGENFESAHPLTPDKNDKATTGAFVPFGTRTTRGQIIKGKVPCSGAIMRIAQEGGAIELVAWGFRNPFGLAFSPDGKLYVSDNGFDDRGSRPVFGAPDYLWQVQENTWYGWPDYSGPDALTDSRFEAPGKSRPKPLLSSVPNKPPDPVARLPVHASSNGFDFSLSAEFGHQGEIFQAEFGDMAAGVGKVMAPVGFKVVRINVETGIINDFMVNRGGTNGPASRLKTGGLERPVSVRFDPSGRALYVVDFGVMTIGQNPQPQRETGVIWKITRAGS
jgi:glucose/arabinose dehydrogenase